MNMKNTSLKLSTIALAIALASCGGGGGGYYGEASTGSGTGTGTGTNVTATANSVKIELSELTIAATNDSLTVTVRALDSNKGGVTGVPLTLSVIDPTNNVTINGSSTVITDTSGNAVFTIKTPATSTNLATLIANGFTIRASANSGQVVQEQTVTVTGDQTVQADTTSIVLFQATKSALNVRADETTVILTAVDANGAVIPNQAISLSVADIAKNGVTFVPAATQTDSNGQISYTLKFNEASRNTNYSAAQFVTDDINLTASFGQSTTTYKYKINVVDSDVPDPVGAITVAYDPINLSESADGVYYTKNVSVQVVDVDGKALANREVTMGVNALTYYKGYYSFIDTTVPKDGTFEKYEPTIYQPCTSPVTTVNQNGQAVNQLQPVNNKSVQVVTFVDNEDQPATKFTTDASGRFNLKIRYPKIYASWLDIQIAAKTTIGTTVITGTESLQLGYIADDVDLAAPNAPNNISPYGSNASCSSGN